MKICVIDVQRIFAESKPAQLGRVHLAEVQKILRSGLDQVVALNQNNIASPQAQNSIAQARNLLQQQMNVEQRAVDVAVGKVLDEAIKIWKKVNDDVDMLGDRRQLVFAKPEFDVTNAILDEVNKLTPTFPNLPQVSINTAPKQQIPSKSRSRPEAAFSLSVAL